MVVSVKMVNSGRALLLAIVGVKALELESLLELLLLDGKVMQFARELFIFLKLDFRFYAKMVPFQTKMVQFKAKVIKFQSSFMQN